jgi:hypothetical protein
MRFLLLVCLGAIAAACGGDETSEPRFRNLVYCENPDVAVPSCGLSGYSTSDDSALRTKLDGCAAVGCHGANAATFEIDLSGPSVQSALAPLAFMRATNGDFLVDEFDPDCSNMLTKVTSQPGSGLQMPIGAPAWSTDELDCFRNYLHDMSN